MNARTLNRLNIRLFILLSFCAFLGGAKSAFALPAFARQTGMDCMACHVGSFGPQLTSYGRNFKLNGYTDGDGHDKAMWKGLSAMVQSSFAHKNKDVPPGDTDFRSNNNFAIDQASIFYGGKLSDHIGVFSQATYDGIADHFAWDNVDARYANNTTLGGKYLAYGVTVNNNPSVEDLWQTAPAWQFPYVASGLAPTPDAAPYMTTLGQTVGGAGVYGLWNQLVYAEVSGYTSLPDRAQRALGETSVSTSDHLHGVAPYWRLALQHDTGKHYFSIGTFGMDANRYPGNDQTQGDDNILDTALDATYQYTSTDGNHNISLYTSLLHERQDLSSTFALGGSSNAHDTLDSFNANASYYYKNTYGVTLGRFDTIGSSDAGLYPDPSNHKPDSAGWTIQLDATPSGSQSGFGGPYLNARFLVQYTAYDKFNGLSNNYDGTGRNASDNNTLYAGVWFAF